MVISIVIAMWCLGALLISIFAENWWYVAIDAICVVANVLAARIAYKRAKMHEMMLLRSTLESEAYIMGEIVNQIIESNFFPKEEPKNDKEDEMEEHQETPV